MLESHVNSPVTARRLRSGPAAVHIDAFADWLHLHGYTPTSIDNRLKSLASCTDWMLASGFTSRDIVSGFEACKVAVEKKACGLYQRGPNRNSVMAGTLFIRFLQDRGELPLPPNPPSVCDLWPTLGEFRLWMQRHRGLTEATLDVYQRILVGFLDALGNDAHVYTADALRTFVLDRAHAHGICRAKSIVGAVRSYVRFLGVTGQCSAELEHAIPSFPSWQLSSTPRFLPTGDVDRVISSCDGYAFALRDRAVLLLLARLGLRASEVAGLKFADVDWRTAELPSAEKDVARKCCRCRKRSVMRFFSI